MSFDVNVLLPLLGGFITGAAIFAVYKIGHLHGYKLGKRDGYMFPRDKGEVK